MGKSGLVSRNIIQKSLHWLNQQEISFHWSGLKRNNRTRKTDLLSFWTKSKVHPPLSLAANTFFQEEFPFKLMTRVEEIQRIGDWNFLSMWSGKLIYFVCTLWKFGKLECVIKTSVISCEGKFQDNRKIWPSFIFYTRRPKIMRRVKRKFLFWDLDQDYWSILILKEWEKVTILNRNWQWNIWTNNYLAWKEVTQIFCNHDFLIWNFCRIWRSRKFETT